MWASIDSISFTHSIVFLVSTVQSRDSPALPLYNILLKLLDVVIISVDLIVDY